MRFFKLRVVYLYRRTQAHTGFSLQHSSGTCEHIISQRAGCVFARLGCSDCLQNSCHKLTCSLAAPEEEDDECATIFAFVLGCQCVYSAVCDGTSVCVSYDLSAPDEVLSVEVGVSASSGGGNRTWTLLSAGRKYTEMFCNDFTLTVFNAHDATSQSFRCANATTMINSAFKIYYCMSKYITC